MKTAIIIPAYNEEKRIGPTLEAYSKFYESLRKKNKVEYEILIAINGTTDSTPNIVKKFSKKNKRIKSIILKQGSKGLAVKEGFKEALKRDYDSFGFVDADMSTSPEEYYKLVLALKEADTVLASRWMKKSVIKTYQPLTRRITSRGFNFLVRSILFINVSDTKCGAKTFRKKVIEDIVDKIGGTRWAFDIDLLSFFKFS